MDPQSRVRNTVVIVLAVIAVIVLALKFIVPVFANVFAGVGIEIPPFFVRCFPNFPVRAFFVTGIVCVFGSVILLVWVLRRFRKVTR